VEGEPAIGAPLTLASARRLTAEIHRERARGRDVVADVGATKRRQKSELEARAASTFGPAAVVGPRLADPARANIPAPAPGEDRRGAAEQPDEPARQKYQQQD
jgi:hypothetical protein